MGIAQERIRKRSAKLIEELKKRKEMSLTEASFLVDYSYWYFRTYIVRGLMTLYPGCIEVDSRAHKIYWVCEEDQGEQKEQKEQKQ